MADDVKQKFAYLTQMLGTPLASAPKEQRNVQLSEEMKTGLLPEVKFGDDLYWGTPSPQARMATLPEAIGGQYVTDPTQSGAMFKYERNVPERLKRAALQGLPSFAFQVDHIIPLSLGGTNDKTNLQVLNWKDHDKKTKVGAVVNELYFNKKISLAEARNKVINFENLNVDGVQIDEETGRTDPMMAAQVYVSWGEPPKIGVKDWLRELPKAPGVLLGKIGGKVGDIMPDNIAGEFGKGVAQDLALGFVEAPKIQYETEGKQLAADVARMSGRVVGTIGSFFMFYGLLGKAVQAAVATKALKGTQLAKWAAGSAPITKAAYEAMGVYKKGKMVYPVAREVATKTGTKYAVRNLPLEIMKNAGVFTIHGQLTKQQEDGFSHRVQRFFEDAAFGSVLAIPGQSIRGYAGLAAGVYTLSSLSQALDGYSDPGEALMNTAVVVGLHGIGGLNNKVVRGNKLDLIATNAAARTLRRFGVEPRKIYRNPEQAARQMAAERSQAVNKIMREASSLEDARSDISALLIAQRQFYKGGLSREARLLEDIKDVKSLVQRAQRMSPAQLDGVPAETSILTNPLLRSFYSKTEAKGKTTKTTEKAPTADFPSDPAGVVTTGVTAKESPQTARDIADLINMGVQNGERVIVYRVRDPKVIEFVKQKNESLPVNMRDPNPEIILGTGVIKNGKFYRTGNLPTETKIGNRYDPNTRQRLSDVLPEHQWPLNRTVVEANLRFRQGEGQALGNIEQMSASAMNKNKIAQAMEARGWDYAIGELYGVPSGAGIGTLSGKPWTRVRFTAQTVEESKAYNEAIALVRSRAGGESLARVRQGIDQIVSRVKEPQARNISASQAIEKMVPSAEGNSLFMTFRGFEEQLSRSGGSDRFFGQNIQGVLTSRIGDDVANVVKNKIKANELTVGDYIGFLKQSKANNKLNENGRAIYDYLLGPGSDYVALGARQRNNIDALKLRPIAEEAIQKKTGQIQQRLPLTEPAAQMAPKKGQMQMKLGEPEKKPYDFEGLGAKVQAAAKAVEGKPAAGPRKIPVRTASEPKVVERTGLTASDGRKVSAQYDRKTNEILIDSKKAAEDFAQKVWTKPKVEGVKKISENAFKSEAEWKKFLVEHEKAHSKTKRAKTETAAEYENRITVTALENMGKKIEKPATQAAAKKPSDFAALEAQVKEKVAPKQQRVDSIAKEFEVLGKEALDNIDIGAPGRGNITIKDYGRKLQSSIESLRPNIGKTDKKVALSDAEVAQIRADIKPTLYQHALDLMRRNFEPKAQASFSGRSVKEIEGEFRSALGLTYGIKGKGGKVKTVEKAIHGKQETPQERLDRWAKEEQTDKTILELMGRNPKELDAKKTKDIKEVHDTLAANAEKFKDTNTYAEGFNSTLHEGMKKMFGDNYAAGKKSWALNSLFNTSSVKGKQFWEKMGLKYTSKGSPEAQPKSVLKKEHELMVEKGKPFTEWTKEDWDSVYSARKREVAEGQKRRETTEKGKAKGEEKEAIEAGLSIGDVDVDKFVTDLSGLDMIMRMRLAGEAGTPMSAKAGATDAKSLLIELQKTFNSYAKPGKKAFVKFEELQNIVNKYKTKS